MPEAADSTRPEPVDEAGAGLVERMRQTPGLAPLVGEAVATWRARAGSEEEPGWRAFSDAFPTFWEFSNRPR